MKQVLLAATALVAAVGVASAQEDALEDFSNDAPLPTRLELGRDAFAAGGAADAGEPVLPSLAWESPAQVMKPYFTVGARVGYLKSRDADRGTWLVGAQGRLHFLNDYLGAEASIEFHQSRFQNGDQRVTTYPVQLTAMFFPLPELELRPYALGGVGWYYTRTTFSGSLSGFSSRSSNVFGFHLGGGGDLKLSPQFSLDVDVRYIFINEPSVPAGVKKQDYDYWQVTGGANFRF